MNRSYFEVCTISFTKSKAHWLWILPRNYAQVHISSIWPIKCVIMKRKHHKVVVGLVRRERRITTIGQLERSMTLTFGSCSLSDWASTELSLLPTQHKSFAVFHLALVSESINNVFKLSVITILCIISLEINYCSLSTLIESNISSYFLELYIILFSCII